MIGQDGERRGIHPPTKEDAHWSSRDLNTLFTDWCEVKSYCHSHWAGWQTRTIPNFNVYESKGATLCMVMEPESDRCDPSVVHYCNLRWTVAVIEWDGKYPGKIGRTIVKAAKRPITFQAMLPFMC